MKYRITLLLTLFCNSILFAQDQYMDSIQAFRNRYINEHEVVKGDDRQLMQFFPLNREYCLPARFEKVENAPWFSMPTSGSVKKPFRIYGILYFNLHDTASRLYVYQSQNLLSNPEYSHYLFIPFTDISNGESSYEAGRYIDLTIQEVEAAEFKLDFNKAYNPYCAYISNKYNCPIPPAENALPLLIAAGEMKFKGHH